MRQSSLDATVPLLKSMNMMWSDEKRGFLKMDSEALPAIETFSKPSWTCAMVTSVGRLPQTIAHRGYGAVYPENTLEAFRGAAKVGAHALETDLHLSKDNVVVISHDGDLKRCYGVDKKIIDCDWAYLSQLRTLKAPREPMPRLQDLLELMNQPDYEHLWTLLDIKLDANADEMMRRIAETIDLVPPSPSRPWKDRLVLGIWAAKYLPLCAERLPGFSISHIGFSTCYARRFLKVPNCSFNMLQKVLLGPIGARFIRDVKQAGRELFVWTVDEENLMRWCIQKEVDGVVTDDPKKFRELCDSWTSDEPIARPSLFQWLYTFWLYFMMFILWFVLKIKFPETVEQFLKTKEINSKATLPLGA